MASGSNLYQEQGDLATALQTYREAIDQSTDRILRARIQYALAECLFARGQYEQAIQEYRIYLRGYGDIAGGAGFSLERVRYRDGHWRCRERPPQFAPRAESAIANHFLSLVATTWSSSTE